MYFCKPSRRVRTTPPVRPRRSTPGIGLKLKIALFEIGADDVVKSALDVDRVLIAPFD